MQATYTQRRCCRRDNPSHSSLRHARRCLQYITCSRSIKQSQVQARGEPFTAGLSTSLGVHTSGCRMRLIRVEAWAFEFSKAFLDCCTPSDLAMNPTIHVMFMNYTGHLHKVNASLNAGRRRSACGSKSRSRVFQSFTYAYLVLHSSFLNTTMIQSRRVGCSNSLVPLLAARLSAGTPSPSKPARVVYRTP